MLDAVNRLRRATIQIANQRLAPWQMTLAGYTALRVMANRPDLSLAQLSRRCFVKPQTMTRIVTRLEERGLIDRLPNPDSERAMSLRVTEAGQTLVSELDPVVNRIGTTIARVMTEQQVAAIDSALRDLAVLVEAEMKEQA